MKYLRLLPLAIFSLICFSLSSCSTIVHGTNQKVAITSNPSCANVWVDNKYAGMTPTQVKVSRKHNHDVLVELEDYEPYEVTLERDISAWVLGNVVFGGFIGVGVDAISGGIYKFCPNAIHAEMYQQITESGAYHQDGGDELSAHRDH